MKIKIYRINKDNPLPTKANPGDAGWDCYVSVDTFFYPGEMKLVPLGIIAQAPEGFHFKLCLRSSMAKKRGFSLANGIGVIDHKFAGAEDEIKALLKAPLSGYSMGSFTFMEKDIDGLDKANCKWGYKIKKGERICQLLLEKNESIEWEEQEDRNFGGNSRGGFGESGV